MTIEDDLVRLGDALRGHGGLTRTDQLKVFSGNRTAAQVRALRVELLRRGEAHEVRRETAGRPALVLAVLGGRS